MQSNGDLWIRCPRLGGEAPFSYCLRESGDIPCQRILFCWQPFFPIEEHLRRALSPQQWEKFENGKPKDKISSIIELAERAKKSG